jgi:hypothetical protein
MGSYHGSRAHESSLRLVHQTLSGIVDPDWQIGAEGSFRQCRSPTDLGAVFDITRLPC